MNSNSHHNKMRAVQINQDHKIRIIETEIPEIQESEILVKPVCCGICGTDLHILKDNFVGTAYPVTPGHEFAGHVVAIGKNVKGFKEGDFVSVDPNVVCGHCKWCQMGRPNLCTSLTPIGVGRAGAAAEYVAVPDKNAFKVKESIGYGVAALIEPLACAYHAVDSAESVRNKRVLIVGGGTMGLLTGIVAKKMGAASVTVSDPSKTKTNIAVAAGIDNVCQPDGLKDELFDVVFESAGVLPALEQAIKAIEKTGTLVQVGVHEEHAKIGITPFKVYERELKFVGSNSCANKFEASVDLMTDIKDKVQLLLKDAFHFTDFEKAIDDMQSGKSIKTQLVF